MSATVLEHERAHDDGGEDYDARHPGPSVIWDLHAEAAFRPHIFGPDFHWDNPLKITPSGIKRTARERGSAIDSFAGIRGRPKRPNNSVYNLRRPSIAIRSRSLQSASTVRGEC